MTREEYEQLLKSDYWKGYSYSLIKERNFTCQDCGRRFPNERNKLQVHHLRYRDINPWSYNPDELVVLCEECHKKRHGIPVEPAYQEPEAQAQPDTTSTAQSLDNQPYQKDYNYGQGNDPDKEEKWLKRIVGIAAAFILLVLLIHFWPEKSKEEKTPQHAELEAPVISDQILPQDLNYTPKQKSSASASKKKTQDSAESLEKKESAPLNNSAVEVTEPSGVTAHDAITETESFAKSSDTKSVESVQMEEIGKEESLSDIYSRITRDIAVKEAGKEGVSTDGLTSDIYSRITHKHAVEEAQKEGVSAEGSTSDIYARITHKHLEERGY